jgi:cell division protein FtsW
MLKKNYTTTLIGLTIALVTIGLLSVYSASNVIAEDRFDNPFYFLIRQLIFAAIGLIIMFIASNYDYHQYKKYATVIFIASTVLLSLVLIPGIGVVRGGARSWLGIGSFGVQPSEFVKIAVMIIVAKFISNYYKEISSLINLIYVGIILMIVFGLIMLQPDFGTGMVIILSSVVLLFIAGLPLKYFAVLFVIGALGIVGLVISAPYRLRRIFAYLDPWSDPLGAGFQIIQSLYAIAPGGLFGVGFNNSVQKYFYLPEPQTDFIFAIVLEELGFIGGFIILFIYGAFIFTCLKISFNQDELFGKFLGLGLTSIIFIQFFINISVVLGIMPVTGVTLPFLSYGGSSLMVTLFSVGIILNISKNIKTG